MRFPLGRSGLSRHFDLGLDATLELESGFDLLLDSPPALVDGIIGFVSVPWLVAITLVCVAWIGSKLLADRLRPKLQERVLRPGVTNAVLLLARVVVVLFAATPIATLVGFRPRNILLSVTVLSVVAAAILAPVARSYIGGFFILMNRPYEVGDMIELVDQRGDEDERGYVDDVTLRYTRIVTLENSFLVVPNEAMRERDVRNLSAEDERNRCSLEVCVTYEGDLAQAQRILERGARDAAGVVTGGPGIRVGSSRYPAEPRAFVREFADHGVRLDLRFWIDDPYRELGVRSAVQENVWDALADADVELAYPHTHHVFDETSGRIPVSLEEAPSSESLARRSDALSQHLD